MLVKCVCANCGHSYLSDDGAGDLSCPRCGIDNEESRNASDIPDAPAGVEPGLYDDQAPILDEDELGFYDEEPQFDPEAPPPMFVTTDRMVRAMIFGGMAALGTGAVVGAALAATKIAVPGVLAVVLSLVTAAACRASFGGRSTPQTVRRAQIAAGVAIFLGILGFIIGSWTVDRLTAERAAETRQNLEQGLEGLTEQAAATSDEGTKLLMEHRINEVRRLQGMSDARLEDYLFRQEAQVNVAILAYAKLRVTDGPSIRFGPDNDPVEMPAAVIAGLLLVELALATWLTTRGCTAKV